MTSTNVEFSVSVSERRNFMYFCNIFIYFTTVMANDICAVHPH